MNSDIKKFMYADIGVMSLLIWPIILLIYMNKGITLGQVGILSAINAMVGVVMEIPTGIISDRIGHKKTLLFGMCIMFVSIIYLFVVENFYYAILYEILNALGNSFISGSDEALVYDILKVENKEDEYMRIDAKIQTYTSLSKTVTFGLSSIILDMSQNLVIAISSVILFLGIISTVTIKHTGNKTEKKQEKNSIVEDIKIAKNNKAFIYLSLLYAIICIFFSDVFYYTSPRLKLQGFELKYIGTILFLGSLASSLGYYILSKKEKVEFKFVNKSIIFVSFLFGVGLILDNFIFTAILYIFCKFLLSIIAPLITAKIQEVVEDDKRATYLSVKSFMIGLMFIITDPIVGILFEKTSFKLIYFLFSVIVLILSTIFINNINK